MWVLALTFGRVLISLSDSRFFSPRDRFLDLLRCAVASSVLFVGRLIVRPPATTFNEIKKCALWALLIGGSTSVIGIQFSTYLAYSGWLGMVVAVALVWPVQLIIGLCAPCFENGFYDFLYSNFEYWFLISSVPTLTAEPIVID